MTKREQYLSSLTNEELADVLSMIPCSNCPVDKVFCDMCNHESCNETILKWLKQDSEKETGEKEMNPETKNNIREITSEDIKIGEHILVDGEEYVAEEANGRECDLCALKGFGKCFLIPCNCYDVIFKKADKVEKEEKVEKEPKYRPYKDTDEMIADYKEHFKISNVPAFCIPLIWVKGKPNFLTMEGTHFIVEIFDCAVRLGNSVIPLQNLFDNYTYLDGSPCGKVEE